MITNSKPLTYALLSLGSNLGKREENLQRALDLIFQQIGNITKVSSVYETPALKFEGDAFLNCVIGIRTAHSANKLMEDILSIEKTLGRKRTKSPNYESRTIDIDLLFFEDKVIHSDFITVPHPRIQERKFVLVPLQEIEPEFTHPEYKKDIKALFSETSDASNIEKSNFKLKNPSEKYRFDNYNYIAIEGNIGAGKTSLTKKIANDFDAKLILERFKDNPFLPKFYKDPNRYSFALEMSFLADRYQQLVDDIAQLDLFNNWIIADYDINKSLIFASITLQEDEFRLYKKLFRMMHKELPKPDLYVYLHQNTDRLMENIQKRGREYERSIQPEYLQKLNTGYLNYIKSPLFENVKIIDISSLDFVKNRADYLTVLDEILN